MRFVVSMFLSKFAWICRDESQERFDCNGKLNHAGIYELFGLPKTFALVV